MTVGSGGPTSDESDASSTSITTAESDASSLSPARGERKRSRALYCLLLRDTAVSRSATRSWLLCALVWGALAAFPSPLESVLNGRSMARPPKQTLLFLASVRVVLITADEVFEKSPATLLAIADCADGLQ